MNEKMVKTTLKEKEFKQLEVVAKEMGKTKSEILRELITTISSRDFERAVSNISLERLEQYSEECWQLLHTPGCVFELENLSKKMPAFVTTWEPEAVHVKYPTFTIQIFSKENMRERVSHEEIEKILQGIANISHVYAKPVDFIMTNNSVEKLDYRFIQEVMCLNIKLKDNIETKNEVVDILEKNGYAYTVSHAFCLRSDFVEIFEDKNEKQYFKLCTVENK